MIDKDLALGLNDLAFRVDKATDVSPVGLSELPKVTAIFAADKNNGIGHENRLPWPHFKEDLSRFQKFTMGKTLAIGTTTLRGIPDKLTGRYFAPIGSNMLTSSLREKVIAPKELISEEYLALVDAKVPKGNICAYYERLGEDAMRYAYYCAYLNGTDEIVIAGGEFVYSVMLRYADKVMATFIDETFLTDTSIEFNQNEFDVVSEEHYGEWIYPARFVEYNRK